MFQRIRKQVSRQRMLAEAGSLTIEGLNSAIMLGKGEIVEYFVMERIALQDQDNVQRSAVHTAVNYWRVGLLEMLIEGGAALNLQDEEGRSALIRALELQQREAAIALTRGGADINLTDNYGRTPIMLAAEQGRAFLVEQFLIKGANLSKQDERGRTALIYAVKEGKVGVVKLLLEYDANPYTPDHIGSRPIDYAGRDLELIHLLREAMNRVPPDPKESSSSFPRSMYLEAFQEFIARLSPERTLEGMPAEKWVKLISESWELLLGFLAITGFADLWERIEQEYIFAEKRNEKIRKEIEWALELFVELRNILYALKKIGEQLQKEDLHKIKVYQAQLTTTISGLSSLLTQLVAEYDKPSYRQDIHPESPSNSLHQALRTAVAANDLKMAQLLIQAGANPYHKNESGFHAIHLASSHPAMMRILMSVENQEA